MKFDIIIQAGQSNAGGCGRGEVEKEYLPSQKVWLLEAKKTVEIGEDNMYITYHDAPFALQVAEEEVVEGAKLGQFALSFAEEYINAGLLAEDRALLIIRAAIGGTGFKKNHWGVGKQLYNKLLEMVDYALGLNEENRVVGLLWHQGEHDAFEGNLPETFKQQLKEQFLAIRARYGNMPIIAGDFVNEWKSKNLASCEPIVAKIKETVAELGNGGFVETSDLPSNNQRTGNGDDIHFCRASQYTLGRRYFEIFKNCK